VELFFGLAKALAKKAGTEGGKAAIKTKKTVFDECQIVAQIIIKYLEILQQKKAVSNN